MANAKSFAGLIPKKNRAPSDGVLFGQGKRAKAGGTSGNGKTAPAGLLAYAYGKKSSSSDSKARAVAKYVKRANS